MHFQISSDFLVGRVLSKRHFFDFDYSKEIAGTLPVNNPTSEAITQPPSRGPRAARPGARVRRAGASGRCHVALPTGRTRGGIPVRCRRCAFSQQRISGRVRRRLPRADMSGTRKMTLVHQIWCQLCTKSFQNSSRSKNTSVHQSWCTMFFCQFVLWAPKYTHIPPTYRPIFSGKVDV